MHQHFKPFFMRNFFGILIIIVCSLSAKAQLTVAAIDSICNAVDITKMKTCTIACGHITSRENCYAPQNEDILLYSSGFILLRDTIFGYQYYYLNNQPVKVTLNFEARKTGKTYNAVYYFCNNKTVKIIGEDASLSDEAMALSCGIKHSYWYPKRKPEFL